MMAVLQSLMGERDKQWGESSMFPVVWWAQGLSSFSFCLFLLGLQQQGIFRVPGSQVEVNDIKNSFERGKYGVIISSSCPEKARVGMNTFIGASVAGAAFINISFQLHLQGPVSMSPSLWQLPVGGEGLWHEHGLWSQTDLGFKSGSAPCSLRAWRSDLTT